MDHKDFTMTITGVHKRPVERLSQEGSAIGRAVGDRERGKRVIIMNSKSEFHQPGQVKATYGRLLS